MEEKKITKDKKIPIELYPSEAKLIEYIRDIKWGSVEIIVQKGRPVVIKKAFKTIKLEEDT